MVTIRATICLLALLVSSCARRLQPRYVEEVYKNLDAVPIIAVVEIKPGSVSPVGRPTNFPSVYSSPLLLYKVTAIVENVLKGDLSPGRAEFFHYTTASVTGPPKLGFYGSVPYRSLLLLRRQQGKLRTAADIATGCSQLVTSGYHPNFVSRTDRPMGENMIDLLLTRGPGASDEGMIRAVFSWMPAQLSLRYTARSLLRLATDETPVVRVSACLKLREILVDTTYASPEAESSDARQLGITDSDLARWREQHKWLLSGGYTSRRYGSVGDPPPTVTALAQHLNGLSLCRNDAALGIPLVPSH